MGKNSTVSDIATGDPFGAGRRQANAAQRAALAAQQEAKARYDETANIVNPATIQGLASLDRDIANQSKNLERQERLISSIDPTIMEASQQALKLLRGEESATLAPLKNQRQAQRQKLLASLREQLGPGAETSTAGIQALTKFDMESSSLFGGAQQSALQALGGTAQQFTSTRPDMLREISGLSQFGQGKAQLQFQQAGLLGNARTGMQQTAGAQYTGDMVRAQQQYAFGNQLMSAGLQVATGGLSGGGSSKGSAGSWDNARRTNTGTWYSND